jgi:hypothetical protein
METSSSIYRKDQKMTASPPSIPGQAAETRRQRGGQPGNNNAYKHGFYAHTFTSSENERLDNNILGEFKDEEALMRSLISRSAEAMKKGEMTYYDYIVALRAVVLAVGRLESLHRTRKAIYDKQTTLDQALDELKYIPWEED